MNQAQKVFEVMMRSKGYTDFTMQRNKYIVPALQTRWIYFQMGWDLKGIAGNV